jgi:hypothetical protein
MRPCQRRHTAQQRPRRLNISNDLDREYPATIVRAAPGIHG